MRALTPLLMVFAAVSFAASGALFMWQSAGGTDPPLAGVPVILVQPRSMALRLLLATVWVAILAHSLRTVGRFQQEGGKPLHAEDHGWGEHGPLILSLLAGAAFPWTAQIGPLPGVLTAATMMAGALVTVLRGDRDGRRRRHRVSVGLYAGWATAATFRTLAALLTVSLGAAPASGAIAAIVLLTLTAVRVQLHLGRAIGYATAVMWALIGTAAATMMNEVAIATACVVAIAALSAVLVKVTT